MYMKYHNNFFISSWLHRINLFHSFPFSCPNLKLGGIWDGPCWVSLAWLPFSSVLLEDLCSSLLPSFVLLCFLTTIALPRVATDVFCPLQYNPACRSKAVATDVFCPLQYSPACRSKAVARDVFCPLQYSPTCRSKAVATDVFCPLQYSPACCSKAAWNLEVHCSWFLPSMADASEVPRHGTVYLGLRDFYCILFLLLFF